MHQSELNGANVPGWATRSPGHFNNGSIGDLQSTVSHKGVRARWTAAALWAVPIPAHELAGPQRARRADPPPDVDAMMVVDGDARRPAVSLDDVVSTGRRHEVCGAGLRSHENCRDRDEAETHEQNRL